MISTQLQFHGQPLVVTAHFSHEHPYFAPTIVGDQFVLARHQDPLGRNFCLLENPSRDWMPTHSAGALIGETLMKLLHDSEEGPDAVHHGEADMAEPVSSQFHYDDEPVILISAAFLAKDLGTNYGAMTLLSGPGPLWLLEDAAGMGRVDAELVARLDGIGRTPLHGRWIGLTAPRPEQGRPGLLEQVFAAQDDIRVRLERRRYKGLARMPIGVTFLEEGPTRGEQRRTWLFAWLEQRAGGQPQVVALIKAEALSETERTRRLPELIGLHRAHAVVVGAGSVGAPVALELAKAGVGRIDIFDGDRYDANNSVRHVLPVGLTGQRKASSVADLCQRLNPFVRVLAHDCQLGQTKVATEVFDEALATASIVIDTTGAQDVSRYASRTATAAGIPTLVAGLTAGSFGADIFAIVPHGPCFNCFVLAQEDNLLPKPPSGPRSAVTPIGCRHPAFAGAGFDAMELASVVVRRAIQLTAVTAYPPTDGNWIVLNFRGTPHLAEGYLDVYRECGAHS